MEKTTKVKLTLPTLLKTRLEKVASQLNVPMASAARIALTEFCQRHESSK